MYWKQQYRYASHHNTDKGEEESIQTRERDEHDYAFPIVAPTRIDRRE